MDGSDARALSSIALNDSVSLGLVFQNPLKIPLVLKGLHLIATVEYEDLGLIGTNAHVPVWPAFSD